jgi:uncharacterized protein (DUF1499 family)
VKTVLALLAVLVLLPMLLLVGGVLGNRLPLLAAPGPLERLRTYMTTNVAQTSPHSRFPELAEPTFAASPDRLFEAVAAAIDALGWERASDPGAREHRAVVVTPVWRFRDDVTARVVATGTGESRLTLRSASRVGRGDLGANTRHILDLTAEISRCLGETPAP